MGKARGFRRSFRFLIVFAILTVGSCLTFAQDTASKCSGPTAEISNISRPTGVLRADPQANETAMQKIVADVGQACASLSGPSALRQARMIVSDNNIILSGTVPTEADGQQLIAIATTNADGRTVFNRLEVVPLQTASRRK